GIPQLGLHLAEKCGVPAEQIMNELIEYLQSPECTSPYKTQFATEWKKLLLTAFGSGLELYGRTLDDKDFDWASLRDKYVLVQFTATWCGPCHMEIPGMKEAYKKYHDKGFEIVSIYISERGADAVAEIKEHVEHAELPWIVISETLTKEAGQPKQGDFFAVQSVPTMLLVDKEGKIIMTNARGEALQTKLAEIFE
ncbi:MAG: TlpA family protein disulfide reductase, partial [Planctomycetaceae bacterium]|nr:TlpA family protein disulfide reductase [Planctomycetaceae bacterium]